MQEADQHDIGPLRPVEHQMFEGPYAQRPEAKPQLIAGRAHVRKVSQSQGCSFDNIEKPLRRAEIFLRNPRV